MAMDRVTCYMGERYKKRRDRHRRMSVTVSPGVHGLDPLRRGSSSLSMNYLTTLGIIVADSESKMENLDGLHP